MDNELFQGLQALSEASFPKKCKTCGRVYSDLKEFTDNTKSINDTTGFMATPDYNGDVILEFYRNCICGSTLMEFFSDGRDHSEKGLKRRAIFEKVMRQLIAREVTINVARAELIKIMNGQQSSLLESFGINTGKRER